MILRPYPNFGEPKSNPGDLIVEMGATHLPINDKDVFIIGTPWFWYGCHETEKYQWLSNQFEIFPDRRFIALGIGSCAPFGETSEFILRNKETAEECKKIWNKFYRIIVRDEESFNFLSAIGIESFLLPCPSVFAFTAIHDPRPGSTLIIDSPAWHEGFRSVTIPEIEGDVSVFKYSNSGRYDYNAILNMLGFLASHETIISARVHCALPMCPHRRTSIIPTDMRWKTAEAAGIKVYPEITEPLEAPRISNYKKLLK